MVSVKVVYASSGKPASGKRVCVSFSGLRGVTGNQITDSNGEAHFDAKPGHGKVIVNGTTKFEGKVEGRVPVYV